MPATFGGDKVNYQEAVRGFEASIDAYEQHEGASRNQAIVRLTKQRRSQSWEEKRHWNTDGFLQFVASPLSFNAYTRRAFWVCLLMKSAVVSGLVWTHHDSAVAVSWQRHGSTVTAPW